VKTHSLAYGEKSEEVTPYKKDYYSLFPSLFLSYALPHNNELQLNYTRRISRPWGGQLNSFKNITDATNISFGNPELDPQYSNAFELNFLKMWDLHTLSFSGYYRTTDNVTEQIRYLQGEVMYSTYENVASSKSSGIEIVAKNKLFHEVIDLTTTLNGFYYELDGFSYQMAGVESPITGDRESDFSWNVKMIANTKLPLGTTLQLTGNYNAKKVVAQGYRQANYTLDAGLRKNFFNKTISVSVNGRDLLNSRKWHTITSGEGFHQDSKNWRGSRRFGLTVTYNFGNMRAKQNKSRKNDGEIENPYQNESEY
jgi:outer membrane receptor protein involved in Fe transport